GVGEVVHLLVVAGVDGEYLFVHVYILLEVPAVSLCDGGISGRIALHARDYPAGDQIELPMELRHLLAGPGRSDDPYSTVKVVVKSRLALERRAQVLVVLGRGLADVAPNHQRPEGLARGLLRAGLVRRW